MTRRGRTGQLRRWLHADQEQGSSHPSRARTHFHVERFRERTFCADRSIKRQDVAVSALNALDIALCDLVGKAASLTLFKLRSATRDPANGTGSWDSCSIDDLTAAGARGG